MWIVLTWHKYPLIKQMIVTVRIRILMILGTIVNPIILVSKTLIDIHYQEGADCEFTANHILCLRNRMNEHVAFLPLLLFEEWHYSKCVAQMRCNTQRIFHYSHAEIDVVSKTT